jgi:hypothetical protein
MIANTIINNSVTDILETPVNQAVSAYAGVGMFFCNAGGANETINIYAIPSGEVADINNIVIKDLTVVSGDTYEFSAEKFLLNRGESIAASGQNGGLISATITYTDIT